MTDRHDHLAQLGEIAVASTRTIMARAGRLPLASYLMTDNGVVMLVAGAHDEINKRMFAAVTKVAGARHRASCTAVVMETSRLTASTEDDKRILADIRKRGGSISEHPSAIDRVVVVTTDGVRQDVREYELVRHHPEMVDMQLVDHVTLEGDARMQGPLMEMHALPDQISLPAFQEVMRDMQEMGLLDGTPVTTAARKGAN